MSSVLQIRPVERSQAKMMIALASLSGDGKTFSALQLAHGLTDFKPEKIGLLDCENRRGSLYSGIFGEKKFQIGDLTPPFAPSRYCQAMREFADAGVEVLIIDSYSHLWEGEGGCEDLAHSLKADGSPRKIADWITAKREHKRFMNTALFLPMHVILCIRAREKMDYKNKVNGEPQSLGIQPICEKNVMFEMTMSFLLKDRGCHRDILKLNGEHESLVGLDGYLTADHGKNLRDWIGGMDPVETAKNTLRLAASKGTDALKEAWTVIPKAQQKSLSAFKDTLKDLAKHADENGPVTEGGADGKYTW